MKSEKNRILSEAVDEIDTQATDDYVTGKFVDDKIAENERLTKVGEAVSHGNC